MLSSPDLSSVCAQFAVPDVECSQNPAWTKVLITGRLVKLPFPLTIRFKSMLQSGVMTRDLDVRWVSSLSWYFLNLFGLQSVFGFILGSDNGEFTDTYTS